MSTPECPKQFIDVLGCGRTLLQLTADLLGVPVRSAAAEECGTLGCAMLAGVGCGLFAGLEEAAERMVRSGRLFRPDPARAGRAAELLRRYRDRKERLCR